jgi:hypothetical protein
MIVQGNKETTAIYIGTKAVQIVYRGVKLVWQAIRSCFGKGSWDDELPWDDEDTWKDN